MRRGGTALSQAEGDWVVVLDTVVEAVAPSFEASLPLLFGEIMKLADEPRKKLSEWRRKAADISTQIKHEKRTVNAEALRRTDAWFDGDSEPSQELEPVLEADHETVESVDDDDGEVNETEVSVASDLRKALEVNASLDDRGASLAKKVALIKPRPARREGTRGVARPVRTVPDLRRRECDVGAARAVRGRVGGSVGVRPVGTSADVSLSRKVLRAPCTVGRSILYTEEVG